MLKPTSETFSERSAEWVRDDVPFGNWIIDTAERHTASAPRNGGRGLTRLPSVGLTGTASGQARQARHLHAATDQTGARHAAARRRHLAPYGEYSAATARPV